MSHLRRPVRNTIRSGSVVYAEVEAYTNGLATVRLGGTRLTNLSVIGGVVQPGDSVYLDYSAGRPYVRPLVQEEPEEELEQDEEKEKVDEYQDYGCAVHHEPFGLGWDQILLLPGTETLLTWGVHYPEYDVQAAYWDTSGMVEVTFFGREYVEIPQSGKWLIHLSVNDPIYQHGFGGYFRVRVFKRPQGETTETDLIVAYTRDFLTSYCYQGIIATTIEMLQKGDQIYMEYYHTYDEPNGELIGDFGTNWYDARDLVFQFIPDTAHTKVLKTSSASAYLEGASP